MFWANSNRLCSITHGLHYCSTISRLDDLTTPRPVRFAIANPRRYTVSIAVDDRFSMSVRPRRLRSHASLREGLAATSLHPSNFVMPLFIRPGQKQRIPVASMPGVFQLSPDVA